MTAQGVKDKGVIHPFTLCAKKSARDVEWKESVILHY